MEEPRILIIVPAFNEAGNVRRAVEEMRTAAPSADVVVIDDGSGDATAAEARRTGAHVITLPFNLGIGGAVQTGFGFALRGGYNVAVQMDGDGQHEAACLEALLRPVVHGEADIVVGSRFLAPSSGYRSSLLRRVGIRFFAQLIGGLTGCAITDPTSGFRAFNARAIRVFAEDYPSDFPEPESLVIAMRRGLRVAEVPVRMRQRVSGQSSIRYLRSGYYMVKVTFAILLNMIKKKKEVSP